jgi:GT2 family glycosyltransferase
VVGFLADLDPILSTMRVGVAPLRFGAGIKGKITMTMGAGIPCVCTSIAAEGMHLQNGVHALIADTAQDFADAVVRVYTDPGLWWCLSTDGKALICREFSDTANRASFFAALNDARALPISLFNEYCLRLTPRAVPAPAEGAQVAVSIIIPVFNQWRFTRACLNSVLEVCQREGVPYEIILADDASSDETVRAPELYPGLRVVKTPKNVGFLRNCNNAARYARGQYLLLLNNDTIVLPGWLSSLYRTLERDPGAAIAGSKLLYPDGSIQEAGGVLFSDGTAGNVGRGYSRDTPVFNYERETDYISGASILVRKSFWDQVGGFDERYRDAYCEDSDLAMTARSLGMRVVYQPASEVVHFEHQSYADRVISDNDDLQRGNIRLFLAKWRDVLLRDHLPAAPWQVAWHAAMRNAERHGKAATTKDAGRERMSTIISPIMDQYERLPGADANHAAGSFPTSSLHELESLLPRQVSASAETGCGKSTILFSNISMNHFVFAFDDRAIQNSSVNFYEQCPITNRRSITPIFGSTQTTLPSYKHTCKYNLVLLDGPHGWPFPELEYYFFYPHIETGGFLIIDDIRIPTIGRMADVLAEDAMWEFVKIISDNTAVFRRTAAECFDPYGDGWWTQIYNRRRVSPARDIYLNSGSIADLVSDQRLDIAALGSEPK